VTEPTTLPEVDVRRTIVPAGATATWAALLATVDAMTTTPARAYARLVRCEPPAASGPRPLGVGSTIPGFHVARCVDERELALEGRHIFSRYALTFRLDPHGEETELAAESRARFPGPHGAAYRLAVIGSGGHRIAVGRMLAAVRRAATRH
jgi:hypothetical protein